MALSPLRTTTASDTHFKNIARGLDDTGPPWQLRRQTMVYVGGHWSQGANLPPLPPGLTPAPDRFGVMGFYLAPEGHGLAPVNVAFGALVVRETWAPDGTQAAFVFHGLSEGPQAGLLARWINGAFHPGHVSIAPGEEEWQAEAREAAGGIRLRARRLPGDRQLATDTNYYIGVLDGATAGYTVAYSCPFHLGEVIQFDIDLPDDHPLAVFRSLQVDYVMLIDEMSMTYSRAFPLDLATPERASTLGERQALSGQMVATLDAFSRIGRAIALADDTGRVLYANSAAEAVLSRLSSGPRLPAPGPAAGREDGAIGPEGLRLALPLAEGGVAFARVMPVGLRLNERPGLMVLLDDPAELGPFDPVLILRLHGLTASEARLAVAVGQGLSPTEAARAQGITRETARTVLKTVYAKLGVNRQAELARLVARFEML